MDVDALKTLVKNEPTQELIYELRKESPTLQELNERFGDVARDIDILTCFETQKTNTVVYDVI
jgi:hypothetical protein